MLNGITQTIETPPVIINNRTMVPLRMVAEFLGMGVDWDGENRLVTITAK
ncbi:hypothetical protein SDC9_122868 [bioreactor metagenome]|uniref:Copper amine oxidase-like N-terminal domain-containing protein n=1 Tax=bioreactor metagenome TaxID=1076179 RepID=A0A645CFZ7_9ZZZZ